MRGVYMREKKVSLALFWPPLYLIADDPGAAVGVFTQPRTPGPAVRASAQLWMSWSLPRFGRCSGDVAVRIQYNDTCRHAAAVDVLFAVFASLRVHPGPGDFVSAPPPLSSSECCLGCDGVSSWRPLEGAVYAHGVMSGVYVCRSVFSQYGDSRGQRRRPLPPPVPRRRHLVG